MDIGEHMSQKGDVSAVEFELTNRTSGYIPTLQPRALKASLTPPTSHVTVDVCQRTSLL